MCHQKDHLTVHTGFHGNRKSENCLIYCIKMIVKRINSFTMTTGTEINQNNYFYSQCPYTVNI